MSGEYDDFAIDIEAVAALLPPVLGTDPVDSAAYQVETVRTELTGFRQRLNGSSIPGAQDAIGLLDKADALLLEPYNAGALRWARNHMEHAARSLRNPPPPRLNSRGF